MVQQNAVKWCGFNNTQVGTLKDKVFLNLFTSILEKRRIKTDYKVGHKREIRICLPWKQS
jgi:hypothetical protein